MTKKRIEFQCAEGLKEDIEEIIALLPNKNLTITSIVTNGAVKEVMELRKEIRKNKKLLEES